MSDTIGKLEEVEAIVKLAEQTFSRYEDLHREKGTEEGNKKANANAALQLRMEEALSLLSQVREEVDEMKRAWERTTADARMYKGVCVKADLWPITVSPNYWAKPRPSRPVPDHGSGPEYLPAPPKGTTDV